VNITLGQIGQQPTDLGTIADEDLQHLFAFWLVLDRATRSPFRLKSNFAREAALYVATSASLGFITNQIEYSEFVNVWGVTPSGEDFLEELNEIIENIDRQKSPDPSD